MIIRLYYTQSPKFPYPHFQYFAPNPKYVADQILKLMSSEIIIKTAISEGGGWGIVSFSARRRVDTKQLGVPAG